jgi:hypothetical protein
MERQMKQSQQIKKQNKYSEFQCYSKAKKVDIYEKA